MYIYICITGTSLLHLLTVTPFLDIPALGILSTGADDFVDAGGSAKEKKMKKEAPLNESLPTPDTLQSGKRKISKSNNKKIKIKDLVKFSKQWDCEIIVL